MPGLLQVLALMESGQPFRLHVDPETGAMTSGGMDDLEGNLLPGTCGHPKICPYTGELHCFLSRCAVMCPV